MSWCIGWPGKVANLLICSDLNHFWKYCTLSVCVWISCNHSDEKFIVTIVVQISTQMKFHFDKHSILDSFLTVSDRIRRKKINSNENNARSCVHQSNTCVVFMMHSCRWCAPQKCQRTKYNLRKHMKDLLMEI